jgi:tetratricopeptide (TPR) repeat protein
MNKENYFIDLLKEINEGIIAGQLDLMTEKLVLAINYYVDENLECEFINIFERASNVVEAVTKRALFLEQLNRVIDLAKERKLNYTIGTYYRYYALSQAFYGMPERGLELINEAENYVDVNSGLFIELRNAKALIHSELDNFDESLKLYEFNYQESKRIDYKPGFRFLHNIGTAYRDLGSYDKAASYIRLGYEYDLSLDYVLNAISALLELAEVYYRADNLDQMSKTIEEVETYEQITQNQNFYKEYCLLKYK